MTIYKDLNKLELQQKIDESNSISNLCIRLGINPTNTRTRKSMILYCKSLGLSFDLLKTNRKPLLASSLKRQLPNDYIFTTNSTYLSGSAIKKRLFNLGVKTECSVCKLTSWMDKPISLQLEHKNGIHNDNRLENLCLLCPNCHSQTNTFAGKNKRYHNTLNKGIQDLPILTRNCIVCSKTFVPKNFKTKCCCKQCGRKSRYL